jgi:hypothetical protein
MARLTGTVSNSTGHLLPGVKVAIGWWYSTKTDNLGKYSIGSLGTGKKVVSFTKKNYGRLQVAITIVEGTNTLNVTMVLIPPPVGQLTGKVTDSATGAAISGVTVTLAGTTTQTDSSGNYGFTGITPGSYTVTFAKAGYNTVTR